jgi:hypothetical protein
MIWPRSQVLGLVDASEYRKAAWYGRYSGESRIYADFDVLTLTLEEKDNQWRLSKYQHLEFFRRDVVGLGRCGTCSDLLSCSILVELCDSNKEENPVPRY